MMNRVGWGRLSLVVALLGAVEVRAQLLKITPDLSSVSDQTAKDALTEMFNELQSQVNANLPQVDSAENANLAEAYMSGISDAMVLAVAGTGTDYATPFSIAEVGGGLGLGADLGGQKISTLTQDSSKALQKVAGGLSPTVVLGFNLGRFVTKKIGPVDMSRMRVWINWFSFNLNKDPVSVKTSSLGFHLGYKIIGERGIGLGLLKWYGLDVGTGFHRSTMNLGISQKIAEQADTSTPFGNVTAQMDSTVNISANSSVNVIPLEVSSGVRLLYVLGLYGGLGTDIAFGKTSGSGSVVGDITLPGAPSQISGVTATSTADLAYSKGPSAFSFRYFAGLQFDAYVMNLFAQFNHSVTAGTMGVNIGGRLYW